MKKRRLVTSMLCASICLASLSVASAEEVTEVQIPQAYSLSIPGVSTYSEEIIWVVKKFNGRWFRRLYNTTTGEYIGNWILCE